MALLKAAFACANAPELYVEPLVLAASKACCAKTFAELAFAKAAVPITSLLAASNAACAKVAFANPVIAVLEIELTRPLAVTVITAT